MDDKAKARPLSSFLRESISDAHVEQLCLSIEEARVQGVKATPTAPSPSRIWLLAGCAVAAAALLVAAALWLQPEQRVPHDPVRPGPLLLARGGALAELATPEAAASPEAFVLSDGSSITLWPGSRARAQHNTGESLVLSLSKGRGLFHVAPGGPRRWAVELSELATVEVVGTVFSITHEPGRASVSVDRGSVRVTSPFLDGEPRRLGAGDTLELHAHPAAKQAPEPRRQPDIEPDDNNDASPRTPTWRTLANTGDFHAAYDALGAGGVGQLTPGADSMAELLILADVARLSGHPREAVPPLERAVSEFASDRRAPVAAFTLGRVEADSLGRHGRAARAFGRCLELGPPRALTEDAYLRLAEAYGRQGDGQSARRVAERYLRQFPDGARTGEIIRWVEPR